MDRYFLELPDGAEERDRDDVARDVIEAVLAVGRTPASVEILGNLTPLRERNPDAVETLTSRPGVTAGTDDTLSGATEASDEVLDAALALLSGSLIELVVRDEQDAVVVARYDRDTHYFEAAADEVRRIEDELPADVAVSPGDVTE